MEEQHDEMERLRREALELEISRYELEMEQALQRQREREQIAEELFPDSPDFEAVPVEEEAFQELEPEQQIQPEFEVEQAQEIKYSSTAKQHIGRRMKNALQIARNVLGEENADIIDMTDEPKYSVGLAIRFPELTIRNKHGHEHKIIDLYVSLLIAKDNFTGLIRGTRGKLSQDEWSNSYAHSHLNSHGLSQFAGFCTGTDDINIRLSSLIFSNELSTENERLDFESFLLYLREYMSYESIEGGPYRYIKNVNSGSLAPISASTIITETRNIMLRRGFMDLIKLSYNAWEGRLTPVESDLVEAEMAVSSSYLVYKDSEGRPISIGNANNSSTEAIRNDNFRKFKFNGEIINQLIVSNYGKENYSGKRYIHPQIKERIWDNIKAFGSNYVEESFRGQRVQAFKKKTLALQKAGKAYSFKRFNAPDTLQPITTTQS